jgi:hypothetical protein
MALAKSYQQRERLALVPIGRHYAAKHAVIDFAPTVKQTALLPGLPAAAERLKVPAAPI